MSEEACNAILSGGAPIVRNRTIGRAIYSIEEEPWKNLFLRMGPEGSREVLRIGEDIGEKKIASSSRPVFLAQGLFSTREYKREPEKDANMRGRASLTRAHTSPTPFPFVYVRYPCDCIISPYRRFMQP